MLSSLPASLRSAMLLLLALLLSACASKPISLPAACPVIPPLPVAAKQPKPDPVCLPNCSAALQRELTNWQAKLTAPDLPASSASQPTKP